MSVKIGRNNGELRVFSYVADETLCQLLSRADIELSGSDEVTDEFGEKIELTEAVENDVEYYVSTNYKNGSY